MKSNAISAKTGGVECEELSALEYDCKKKCEENCQGKAYFTDEQIFYIAGFFTLSPQLEEIPNNELAKQQYKIDDNHHPFSWASNLQKVVLEVDHLMQADGKVIKATLSKFTSLKKSYLVWRKVHIDVLGESFISRYAS